MNTDERGYFDALTERVFKAASHSYSVRRVTAGSTEAAR
jgi:hypothetical protein